MRQVLACRVYSVKYFIDVDSLFIGSHEINLGEIWINVQLFSVTKFIWKHQQQNGGPNALKV